MMTFKLVRHSQNQFGYPVSLTVYDKAGELVNGFTLINRETKEDQIRYISELNAMTGWTIELMD